MAKIKEEGSKLEKALAEFEKSYGKGSVIHGNDSQDKLDVVSTGSILLDMATDIGGIPIGKLIEVYGPESSGKSTMMLHIIAEFQKLGKKCVLIDSEQSFDKSYAIALGVNVDDLYIVFPECQEDGYNMAQKFIETGEISLVVIDSHTSMQPKKIVDGEVGEHALGLQARVNSTALGKIKPLLRDNKCTMISISQIRQMIGAMGNPNIATGGLAYKFYADMRFYVSKQVEKEKDQNKTGIEIIKSKCGKPYGKAFFNIQWGTGIDKIQEIIDLAIEFKMIKLGGAGWMTLEDETKIQGSDKLKEFFRDNPEYYEQLRTKVLQKIKNEN